MLRGTATSVAAVGRVAVCGNGQRNVVMTVAPDLKDHLDERINRFFFLSGKIRSRLKPQFINPFVVVFVTQKIGNTAVSVGNALIDLCPSFIGRIPPVNRKKKKAEPGSAFFFIYFVQSLSASRISAEWILNSPASAFG